MKFDLNNISTEDLKKLLEQKEARASLVWPDTDAKGQPLKTLANFRELLRFVAITIKFNKMTKDMEIEIPGFERGSALYNNAVIGKLISICNENGWPLGTDMLMHYANVVAHENAYHPVQDWIDQQVWDGTSRLQDFYNSVILYEPNPMKEVILRKWALSLVAALYHQNFSCEGVLTLTGPQGIGKTTFVEMLIPRGMPDRWNVSGVVLDMKNKDTLFKALSGWLCELGELDATFKKSEIEALKGFITESTDTLRAPYDRRPNSYPRQTVMYATVNETEFLQDSENRRFWVLKIKGFNYLDIDIGQFWAEMKQIYIRLADKIGSAADRNKNNEWGWFMSPSERAQMKPLQNDFKTIDPVEQILERFVLPMSKTPATAERLNATTILQRCDIKLPQRRDVQIATKWLRAQGFEADRQKKWAVVLDTPDLSAPYQYDENKVNTKLLERLGKKKG